MAKQVVDLQFVQEVVGDIVNSVRALDGSTIDDNDPKAKAQAAEINRKLLNLADQFALGSALVRNAYWNGKGLMSYEL